MNIAEVFRDIRLSQTDLREIKVTRDSLYFAYNELIRSIKKDGWKMIVYRNCSHHTQLFCLPDDSQELNDLSQRYPQKIRELTELVLRYRASWENTKHLFSENVWNEQA